MFRLAFDGGHIVPDSYVSKEENSHGSGSGARAWGNCDADPGGNEFSIFD